MYFKSRETFLFSRRDLIINPTWHKTFFDVNEGSHPLESGNNSHTTKMYQWHFKYILQNFWVDQWKSEHEIQFRRLKCYDTHKEINKLDIFRFSVILHVKHVLWFGLPVYFVNKCVKFS